MFLQACIKPLRVYRLNANARIEGLNFIYNYGKQYTTRLKFLADKDH